MIPSLLAKSLVLIKINDAFIHRYQYVINDCTEVFILTVSSHEIVALSDYQQSFVFSPLNLDPKFPTVHATLPPGKLGPTSPLMRLLYHATTIPLPRYGNTKGAK